MHSRSSQEDKKYCLWSRRNFVFSFSKLFQKTRVALSLVTRLLCKVIWHFYPSCYFWEHRPVFVQKYWYSSINNIKECYMEVKCFYRKLRGLDTTPFFLFFWNGRNGKWYAGISFIAQKRLLFNKSDLSNFKIMLNTK